VQKEISTLKNIFHLLEYIANQLHAIHHEQLKNDRHLPNENDLNWNYVNTNLTNFGQNKVQK
jgi:hydroxypyruvate isomerase